MPTTFNPRKEADLTKKGSRSQCTEPGTAQTPAFKAKNDLKQYTTGSPPRGKLGGLPSMGG